MPEVGPSAFQIANLEDKIEDLKDKLSFFQLALERANQEIIKMRNPDADGITFNGFTIPSYNSQDKDFYYSLGIQLSRNHDLLIEILRFLKYGRGGENFEKLEPEIPEEETEEEENSLETEKTEDPILQEIIKEL